MSQNRFTGVYLDFNDIVLLGNGAQQTTIEDSFFLGGGQIKFTAPKANSIVFGVSILGNVWYDTNSPTMAVNETLGTWTSITDLVVAGSNIQSGAW